MEEKKTKVCTKCGIEKGLEEFPKKKGGRNGRSSYCRGCFSEYQKLYAIKNKDKISEKSKQYRNANKEKIAKRSKERYLKDKDRIKQYQTANHFRISQVSKEYREKHREKYKNYNKEYHKNNFDSISQRHKNYRKENKDAISEYERNYSKATRESVAKYSVYANKLTVEEDSIEGENGELLCKCSKCKEYFSPLTSDVRHRVQALKGNQPGESRLYCSEGCKQDCDIYHARALPKSQRNEAKQARCNQKLNKEQLLQIQLDEFGYNFCDKCGKEFKQSELIIHHNIMVSLDKNMADDMSHQMLVCKEHHEHKGCI